MEKEKMGIDPITKEEINKEGWEDEYGAVIIAKEEDIGERKRLLEKLEAGETTKDLGTYIKLHKEIILPNKEILDQEAKEELLKSKGCFLEVLCYGYEGEKGGKKLKHLLQYIDKDGNLARVALIIDDIADMKKKIIDAKEYSRDRQEEIVESELYELGFNNWWGNYSEEDLERAEAVLQDEIKKGFLKFNDDEEGRKKINRRKEEILGNNKTLKLQKIINVAIDDYKKRLEEQIKTAKKEEFVF